jgi:hypothetical protein
VKKAVAFTTYIRPLSFFYFRIVRLVLEWRGMFTEAKMVSVSHFSNVSYYNLYLGCQQKGSLENQQTIHEETMKIKHANLTGEILEEAPTGRSNTATLGKVFALYSSIEIWYVI